MPIPSTTSDGKKWHNELQLAPAAGAVAVSAVCSTLPVVDLDSCAFKEV
jgi:hypothetical protein